MWYWNMDRHIYQWNWIKIPEINQYIYGQLLFNKGAKMIQGERLVVQRNGAGTTGYLLAM